MSAQQPTTPRKCLVFVEYQSVRHVIVILISFPLGLTWRKIGDTEPTNGQRLENAELAEALERKIEFTKQEWEAFGVKDLRVTDFVKSGESYFVPAGTYIILFYFFLWGCHIHSAFLLIYHPAHFCDIFTLDIGSQHSHGRKSERRSHENRDGDPGPHH